MSEERLTALEARLAELSGGGASIRVEDPRISRVQNWILASVGGGIIVALGWLANSVDNLNRNFAALSEWRTFVEQRLNDLEGRNGRP